MPSTRCVAFHPRQKRVSRLGVGCRVWRCHRPGIEAAWIPRSGAWAGGFEPPWPPAHDSDRRCPMTEESPWLAEQRKLNAAAKQVLQKAEAECVRLAKRDS